MVGGFVTQLVSQFAGGVGLALEHPAKRALVEALALMQSGDVRQETEKQSQESNLGDARHTAEYELYVRVILVLLLSHGCYTNFNKLSVGNYGLAMLLACIYYN